MSISGVLTTAGKKAMAKGFAGVVSSVSIQNVASYFVIGEGGADTANVAAELGATGNGSSVAFSFTLAQKPIKRGSVTITAGAVVGTDNGNSVIAGAGVSGTMNYKTGVVSLNYSVAPAGATPITVAYDYRATPKVPDVAKTSTEAEATSATPGVTTYLARYKKLFGADSTTVALYVETPTPRVTCTCFLDLPEFIDDGRGDAPCIWELGVYDIEDQLIGYATLTKESKNGSTQFLHTITFIW